MQPVLTGPGKILFHHPKQIFSVSDAPMFTVSFVHFLMVENVI